MIKKPDKHILDKMSYVPTDAELENFMIRIFKSIAEDGISIENAWDGDADTKEFIMKYAEEKLTKEAAKNKILGIHCKLEIINIKNEDSVDGGDRLNMYPIITQYNKHLLEEVTYFTRPTSDTVAPKVIKLRQSSILLH